MRAEAAVPRIRTAPALTCCRTSLHASTCCYRLCMCVCARVLIPKGTVPISWAKPPPACRTETASKGDKGHETLLERGMRSRNCLDSKRDGKHTCIHVHTQAAARVPAQHEQPMGPSCDPACNNVVGLPQCYVLMCVRYSRAPQGKQHKRCGVHGRRCGTAARP